MPWREARWCAVDVELTGLERRGEIIAIGAVQIAGGGVLEQRVLYTLARPKRAVRPEAVRVHRLRAADLVDAPPLRAGLDGLLALLAGCVPVFHTAAVERRFLGRELRRLGLRLPPAADTEALGRLWLREERGVVPARLALGRLARALAQPAHKPHHALGDALTTAHAFVALAERLDALEPQTVGSLLAAPERLHGPRRMGPM